MQEIVDHGDSWKLVEVRRATKRRLLDCKEEDKDAMTQDYRVKNVTVKRSPQHAKRLYVDVLATDTQTAA